MREWSFLRDLLLKNMGWTVGDGVSINIWQDPWLCLNKQERPMGPPSEQSVDLCVADLLVDGGKHWDRQKLQLLLPAYEEKILCIKPSLIGAQDKLIWLGTKGGEYSVKSGYYVAVEEEPDTRTNDAGFNWKRNVWALDCAPKVKLFAWKLLKGAIPVGERLLERHIEVDPRCKRCGNNESITHLLFQCQFAQKVWQLAPLLPGMDSSGMLDLMVVWPSICNQKSLPPAGIVNGSVVPWVMWSLWKARNRLVFEGFSASPEDTLSTAIRMAREWSLQSKPEKMDTSRSRKPEMIAPTGMRIVRSEAAWSASSLTAGAGWVILSSPQNMTFQQHLEFVASPLMAEGLALREAVLTCQRLKLQHIRFESDSAQLIKCLSSNETIAELHSVVFDILKLSEFF